jgi:hypothetical protein
MQLWVNVAFLEFFALIKEENLWQLSKKKRFLTPQPV